MTIGESIRKHRKAKRITQAQLSEMLGLTDGAPNVCHWEKGYRTPSWFALREIAKVLGKDVILDALEDIEDG